MLTIRPVVHSTCIYVYTYSGSLSTNNLPGVKSNVTVQSLGRNSATPNNSWQNQEVRLLEIVQGLQRRQGKIELHNSEDYYVDTQNKHMYS